MKYYSTNKQSPMVSLPQAVVKGLADDNGLYMPESIKRLPDSFFHTIGTLSFQEIAFEVANSFFGADVASEKLHEIVTATLNFDIPLVKVEQNIFSLELFHGPTMAFKDVGARFMSRLLGYFVQKEQQNQTINVLVATSGDTGSAVANGFLEIDGIQVHVLYPKGQISKIQEAQFTTLGKNITALEIDGTFDDCQQLVKSAFLDNELNKKMHLTSANSINVARFLPQAFYYFYAFSQLRSVHPKQSAKELEMVVAVPSGNYGNLTAGLIAKRMGLPVKRFVSANNQNNIFYQYLQSSVYNPKPSVSTLANAMDVGNPSNFARILDLFDHNHSRISNEISGYWFSDQDITATIQYCLNTNNYLLDPHGACAYQALKDTLTETENGIFLETAHPAKFADTMQHIVGKPIAVPEKLAAFMKGKKQTVELDNSFKRFKEYLLNNQ